jgi:hypothetical protein
MAFVIFFMRLFYSNDASDIDLCLRSIERRVTESMNEELLKLFSKEEIFHVIQHMGPLKALSPDSFLAGFFSKKLEFDWRRYLSCGIRYSQLW